MIRRLLTTVYAAGLALIAVAGCDRSALKENGQGTATSRGAAVRGEMPRLLGLDGQPIPEPAADTRSTVILFVRTDCPIANRFAPEIRRLADEFSSRGASFRLVYAAAGDTPAKVRSHQAEYNLALPTALDHEQRLASFLGAKATPEAFVLDSAGQVVYRGRIDDRFVDYGKARAEPSRRDLAMALEEVLAGKPASVAETQAIGCPLEGTP